MAAAGAKVLIAHGAVAGALGVAAVGCGGGNDPAALRAVRAAPAKTIAGKTALLSFSSHITAESGDLSFDATIHGDGSVDFEHNSGDLSLDMSDFATQAVLLGASTRKIGSSLEWRGRVIDYLGVSYIHLPALHRFYTRAQKPWIEVSPTDLAALSLDGLQTRQLLQLLHAATSAEKVGTGSYRVKIPIERARAALSAEERDRLAGYFKKVRRFSGDELEYDVTLDDEGRLRRMADEFRMKQKGVSGGVTNTTELSLYGVPVAVTPPPPSQIEPASVLSKNPAGRTLAGALARTRAQRARVVLTFATPHGKGAGARPAVRRGVFDFRGDRGRLAFVGEYGNDARFLGATTYYRPSAYSGGGGRKAWQRFTCPFTHTATRYTSDLTDAFDDPRAALRLLDRHGSGLARAGRDLVHGVETTRYHGTIAPGTLRREEVDVWIDTQGLIRRERLTMSSGTTIVTLDLPEFGVPVRLAAPPAEATTAVACRRPARVGP